MKYTGPAASGCLTHNALVLPRPLPVDFERVDLVVIDVPVHVEFELGLARRDDLMPPVVLALKHTPFRPFLGELAKFLATVPGHNVDRGVVPERPRRHALALVHRASDLRVVDVPPDADVNLMLIKQVFEHIVIRVPPDAVVQRPVPRSDHPRGEGAVDVLQVVLDEGVLVRPLVKRELRVDDDDVHAAFIDRVPVVVAQPSRVRNKEPGLRGNATLSA
mmetsp:Transcript_34413/g.78498  ORF Transcript_34413/g.78498 Transcript_34413/m.78498 type:complete len:219 (-) Transcript_34413:123-779(-)